MQQTQTKYNLAKDPNYYYNRMRPLAKFLYHTKAAKFYYNGDTLGFVWRFWHPLTWIFLPLLTTLYVLIVGVPQAYKDKDDIGIGINSYFKQHPDQLQWFIR
jgi:hypothetical protein